MKADELYTHSHMENAMLLMEYLSAEPKSEYWGDFVGQMAGTAGVRDYVAQVAVEMDSQLEKIGIQWGEEAEWHDLCQRMAKAMVLHPSKKPADLVRDVYNAELRIVFHPPATE